MISSQIKVILNQQQQTYTIKDVRKILAIHIANLTMMAQDHPIESAIAKYFENRAIAN